MSIKVAPAMNSRVAFKGLNINEDSQKMDKAVKEQVIKGSEFLGSKNVDLVCFQSGAYEATRKGISGFFYHLLHKPLYINAVKDGKPVGAEDILKGIKSLFGKIK